MTVAAFADSSALVKFYADERGYQDVRALSLVVVSQAARVEVPAALWKKHRLGELTAGETTALVSEFEADYFGGPGEAPRFVVVTMTPVILDEGARLTGIHGLRAYDAIQLASALAAREAAAEDMLFVAFDKALCEAAAVEGLQLQSNVVGE